MKKGKTQIVLSFYAALAFIVAFLGMPQFILLLLGFVLVVEKDEWTVKQIIQALMVSLVYSIVNGLEDLFDIFTLIPSLASGMHKAFVAVDGIVNILLFVFALIALLNVIKEKDAGIPFFSTFAEWAYGKVVKKEIPTQQMNMPYQGQQPMGGQFQNMPYQGQQPMGGQFQNMPYQGQQSMGGQFQQPMQNQQQPMQNQQQAVSSPTLKKEQ